MILAQETPYSVRDKNIARAKQYFDFEERAVDLYERHSDLLAKQHGVNFQDFASFQQVTPTLKVQKTAGGKDEAYREMLSRKIQEIAGSGRFSLSGESDGVRRADSRD